MSNTTRHQAHRRQVGPRRVAIAATAGTCVRQEQECIETTYAIADTGATSIFIMEGVPVKNKRVASHPLTINLPNGAKVRSTHECDVMYPGLPVKLTGHIVPGLTISSLIGIRVLCEAGCNVIFNKNYCHIIYNGVIILRGHKDPKTDLWLLPILGHNADGTQCTPCPHSLPGPSGTAKSSVHSAMFAHSITTRANKIKFQHQALCNPKISRLLKATRRGFLKGCPYI